MSEIRFENASKTYAGDVTVISDLNLTIEDGEFVVLVGPSGCAKSTTLRMIAGLESITGGSLYIGGRKANDLSPSDRNISMVFQSYALFPNMTVRKNLSFGMEIRKHPTEAIAKDVARVADMLGLSELLDRKPKELSGGQAQRVALGRAMIRQPSAFLFDEPLSNLDAELRVNMRGEITQMQKELGTTTVYVTHDQTEAMTMGDRIAVMNKGKIMQVGPPLELYENPANMFVAGFIGSPRMNFLPVKKGQCLGRPLPETATAPRHADPCAMGVRPEHIVITADGSAETALAFDGKVVHLEALGHESLVRVVEPNTEQQLTFRAGDEFTGEIRPDDTLHLAIPGAGMKFFDLGTGERIA